MVKEKVVQKGEGKRIIAQRYVVNGAGYAYMSLKPTGRWQIEKIFNENDELVDTIMYVEHKGLIFRKWVHENDIRFVEQYVPEIVIVECEKRGNV